MGRSESAGAPRGLGGPPALALLRWFERHRRPLPWRRDLDPYRRWVAEVILQQTRVGPSIARFEAFLARFPDVHALARARRSEVLKAWEGAGYYARARRLHEAARRLTASGRARWPSNATEWLRLPGVGPYISAALASRLLGERVVGLEANGMRVTARFSLEPGDLASPATRQRLSRLLAEAIPLGRSGDFNEALMELGETVCRPSHPDCPVCPLHRGCQAYRSGATATIPRRRPRPKRRVVPAAIAWIERSGRLLVHRRPSEGLLGGLWELPGGKLEPLESPRAALRREVLEETGLALARLRRLGSLRHAYSHFTVELTVFSGRALGRFRPAGPRGDYRWVSRADFERLARPQATVRAARLLAPNLGADGASEGPAGPRRRFGHPPGDPQAI